MPYCVVFNCKSSYKTDKDISWFSFPKEPSRRKQWIHYCKRKDFTPSKYSKICGKHFSRLQYGRDPLKLAEYGYLGARPSLNPDAVPDVQWCVRKSLSEESVPKGRSPRAAFQKRQKHEVLKDAFDMHDQEEINNEESDDGDNNVDGAKAGPSNYGSMKEGPITFDVGTQVSLSEAKPKPKTRRIQVGQSRITLGESVETGVQCEPEKVCERCKSCTCSFRLINSEDDNTMEQSLNDSISDSDSFRSDHIDDNEMDTDFNPDETFDESDDDIDTDEEYDAQNYRLEETDNPLDEKYYVVSESSLSRLLSVCAICSSKCVPIIEFSKGTMISTVSSCEKGHINKWQSQSTHKKLPWFNLQLSSAILISGNSVSKVLSLFHAAKLQTLTAHAVTRLQTFYTVPATIEEFDFKQADLLESIKQKEHVVLGGDGRCDSPGYSAKYGSYTLMDLETNKILDIQLIQCNEVKGSTHMELEGLKRGLRFLTHVEKVKVKDLVTDRHVMIKSYMRNERQQINHYFDVWHIAKGISKKLEAAAKKRGGSEIRPWIKSIVNHCYWVAASCGDNRQLKVDKWKSITNHIANIHSHESSEFPRCEHAELVDQRKWIREGSRCHKMIKNIIESPCLLRDIPNLSPVHQTYGIEVFHSVLNNFAPNSTHFFYLPMLARVYVSALHFNENGSRQQALTKDGKEQWKTSYSKAKKGTECVVKPHKVAATFEYVSSLMTRIFHRREQCPSLLTAREDYIIGHKADEPRALTHSYEKFNKDELINQRSSRFGH